MTHCASPTLDDLLADPIVQATMRADRVNSAALRRDFARVADRLADRPRPAALALAGARVRFGTEPGFVGPRLATPRADRQSEICCC